MKPRSVMFAAVALLFAVAVVLDLDVFGTGIRFYRDLLFLSICVTLAVISFRDRVRCSAPDFLTIPGILAGLAFAWFVPVQDKTADAVLRILSIHAEAQLGSLAESILGALLPSCSLWLLGWLFERFKHKEGVGFGAVKTVGTIGAFLGTGGALATIVLGSCLGSIFGILYIKLIGTDTKTYQLPFAGILAGTSVVVLLNSQ